MPVREFLAEGFGFLSLPDEGRRGGAGETKVVNEEDTECLRRFVAGLTLGRQICVASDRGLEA